MTKPSDLGGFTAADVEAAIKVRYIQVDDVVPIQEVHTDVPDDDERLVGGDTSLSDLPLLPTPKPPTIDSPPKPRVRVKRPLVAYRMWHEGAEMEELCTRLRTPDNPLKAATVRYVSCPSYLVWQY